MSLHTHAKCLPDCEAGTEVQTSGGSLCGPPREESSAHGYGGHSCYGTPQVPGWVPKGRKKAPFLAEGPLCVWV